MSRKKYTSDHTSRWRRLITYPKEQVFKMFVGQCFVLNNGRAEHLERILNDHYKTYPKSEQEFLIKSYDNYLLNHIIRNWPVNAPLLQHLSSEMIQFLYSKIKYRKVMYLNTGFDERLYQWNIMSLVFDEIFSSCDHHQIKVLSNALNTELQKNILAFAEEVKKMKSEKA